MTVSPLQPIATTDSHSAELAALVGELTDRLRDGEAVQLEALLREHPEHAELLRELWPAMQVITTAALESDANEVSAETMPQQQSVARTLGDFRILREIGRGGMGVVYEAEQLSLGRRMCLKVLPFAAVLDDHQLQRFKNEALAAAHRAIASNLWHKCCVKSARVKWRVFTSLEDGHFAWSTYDGTDSFSCNSYTFL